MKLRWTAITCDAQRLLATTRAPAVAAASPLSGGAAATNAPAAVAAFAAVVACSTCACACTFAAFSCFSLALAQGGYCGRGWQSHRPDSRVGASSVCGARACRRKRLTLLRERQDSGHLQGETKARLAAGTVQSSCARVD